MRIVGLLFIVVPSLFVLSSSRMDQDFIQTMPLPVLKETQKEAFSVGEKLRYRVTYGFMDAGEAIMELKATNKKGKGRELIHAIGTGKTLGAFNAIYRVYDTYESYLDKESHYPWYFKRRVDEGGYKISQDYIFNQNSKKVKNEKGKLFNIPFATQDMISAFYHARALDMRNMSKGKTFEMNVFMDDELFKLKIRYLGDEEITVRKGTFTCHKFGPVMQKGRYFENEEDVNFWITADRNKIPVLVKAKIPVGWVMLQLVEWEGLTHSLASLVK